MVKLEGLTKKYGEKTVVDHLSITLQPGIITGFLGPNGAGKSTTMKMMVSLVNPTEGRVSIDGKSYNQLENSIQEIGTLIDPSALDKNLTAFQHLNIIATLAGIDLRRVDEMLAKTGLVPVKDEKVKTFSLGMKQRLGVATALLSDPNTVILDEPFNGLDVDGIRWLRSMFRELADQGKIVIVSSHLMSEIQAIADRIVIIGQGKLLADMTIEEMNAKSLSSYVLVHSNNDKQLKEVLEKNTGDVFQSEKGLEVRNLKPEDIGQIAFESNFILSELTSITPSLEDVFTEVTNGKVEFTAKGEITNDETN